MLRGVIYLALVHFAGPDSRPRVAQVLCYIDLYSAYLLSEKPEAASTFRTLGQITILTSAQPPAMNGNIYKTSFDHI